MTVDALTEFGLTEMAEPEIDQFLRSQGVGVLGLPAEAAPYLLPLAFGYDGDDRLYFTFFVGESSRKATLSRRADEATFLVFKADSVFIWESVLLTGAIEELGPEEWEAHADVLSNAWRLDVFERAATAGELHMFEFQVADRRGLRYAELPPGFAPEATDADSA